MGKQEVLNVIYSHMMFNEAIETEDFNHILSNYDCCKYDGVMYRVLNCKKIIKTDRPVSFSKSAQQAKNIVMGMQGHIRNGLLIRQDAVGIDLVKLLKLFKQDNEFGADDKKRIQKLLNNFRYEEEIVSVLSNNYHRTKIQ